jgi:hypothetical protein
MTVPTAITETPEFSIAAATRVRQHVTAVREGISAKMDELAPYEDDPTIPRIALQFLAARPDTTGLTFISMTVEQEALTAPSPTGAALVRAGRRLDNFAYVVMEAAHPLAVPVLISVADRTSRASDRRSL